MLAVLLCWFSGQVIAQRVRNTFLAILACVVAGVVIAYVTTFLWSQLTPEWLQPAGTVARRVMSGMLGFPLLTLAFFGLKRGKAVKAWKAGKPAADEITKLDIAVAGGLVVAAVAWMYFGVPRDPPPSPAASPSIMSGYNG